MIYTLKSDEPYSVSLCENDEIKSVLQNLSLLFATKKGTIPMYRNYGLKMDFIDRPQNVAEVLLLEDITEAVEEFEPRAKVIAATIEYSGSGELAVIAKVEINI